MGQLFLKEPSALKEALRSFTVLETPVYANKHIGLSGQLEAMPCECSQQAFMSSSRGSSRESRHSRRARTMNGENTDDDANNTHKDDDEDDDNELCGPDSNCINRLTFIECFGEHCGCPSIAETESENAKFRRVSKKCAAKCANRRFQNREYAKIDVFSAGKKGFGVRALEAISAGQFIFEYTGEVLDEARFVRRQQKYEREGVEHFYFMMLQKEEYIDATEKGSIARFCNHSCNPNAAIEKWVVGPKLRMGLFAKKDILPGEEICFDYKVDRYGSKAQPCYCNEPNCSGFLGGRTQTGGAVLPPSVIEGLGLDSETVSAWPERALERLLKCNLDLVRVLNEQQASEKALKQQSQPKAVSPLSEDQKIQPSNPEVKRELPPLNLKSEQDPSEVKNLSPPGNPTPLLSGEQRMDQPTVQPTVQPMDQMPKAEIKEEDQPRANLLPRESSVEDQPSAEDLAKTDLSEYPRNNLLEGDESLLQEQKHLMEEQENLQPEEGERKMELESSQVLSPKAKEEPIKTEQVLEKQRTPSPTMTPEQQNQHPVPLKNELQDGQQENLSEQPERTQLRSPSLENNSSSTQRKIEMNHQGEEVDLQNKSLPPNFLVLPIQAYPLESGSVMSQEEVNKMSLLPKLKCEIPTTGSEEEDQSGTRTSIPSPVKPLSESELLSMQQAQLTQVQNEKDNLEQEFYYHLSLPTSFEARNGNHRENQGPLDLHQLPPVVQPLVSNNELFYPSDAGSRNSTKRKQTLTNQLITILGSKPLTTDMQTAREELISSFPLTEMTLDDLPEFMRILMQLQESPWIIRLMLMRVLANEDQTLQSGILNMHGYQIMGTVLNRWSNSQDLLGCGLQVLQKWPKVTKNKISSSQIESVVTNIRNENINPEVTKLASDLLEEWSGLSMGYRIPRRKISEKPDKTDNGNDHDNDNGSRSTNDTNDSDAQDLYSNNNLQNHESVTDVGHSERGHLPARGHKFNDTRKPRITPEMEEENRLRKREEEEERLRQQAIAQERERQQAEIQRIIDEASGVRSTAASLTPSATPDSSTHADSLNDGNTSHSSERKRHSIIESSLASYVPKLVFIYQNDIGRDRCKRHARDIVHVLVKKEKSKDTNDSSFDLTRERKNKIKGFVKDYMQKVLSRHRRPDSAVLPSPKRVHGNS